MRHLTACGLLLAITAVTGDIAAAQDTGMGMAMPMNTLLVAQLDGEQVVGGRASRATGTGAFLLNSTQHSLSYDLSYQGLEAGAARRSAPQQ